MLPLRRGAVRFTPQLMTAVSRSPPSLQAAPRRSVQTVGTKKPTPPAPIEPSDAQSMPLGKYYEYILDAPQPIPKEKPEEPPASAAASAKAASSSSAGSKKA